MHQTTSTMAEVVVRPSLHGFKLLLVGMAACMVLMTVGVQAVDIQGFNSATECSGEGYTYSGIAQRICTAMDMGSVLIRDLSSCQTGRVYRNGGCKKQVGKGNGPTVWCFVGGGFTGAKWYNGCKGRRLQGVETDDSPKCTGKDVPNGVHFTENPALGSWVLKTPNAKDIMGQLKGVDDAEKANWLRALGAHFVPGPDTLTVVY